MTSYPVFPDLYVLRELLLCTRANTYEHIHYGTFLSIGKKHLYLSDILLPCKKRTGIIRCAMCAYSYTINSEKITVNNIEPWSIL